MKFEKREITLNEYDSIQDLLFAHERLAFTYLESAKFIERKELRELLKSKLAEVLDEIFLLEELLNHIREEQV